MEVDNEQGLPFKFSNREPVAPVEEAKPAASEQQVEQEAITVKDFLDSLSPEKQAEVLSAVSNRKGLKI